MPPDAIVQVDDETVVQVNLDDLDAGLVGKAAGDGDGADKGAKQGEKAQPERRQRQASAADEAADALTQSLKASEDRRIAAEATAAAERTRAENATRLATQRETENRELRDDNELTKITSGIEVAQRDLDAAQTAFEAAQEAGDFKAAATANTKVAKAASAVERLEARKLDYEAGATKTKTAEGRVEATQPGAPSLEQYLAGFNPTAQSWIRAHPECAPPQVGGNASKNAAMMSGHYAALKDGIQEGSPDYYRVIEEHAGYRDPVSKSSEVTRAGEGEREGQPERQQQQKRPPVSAPITRDGAESGGGRSQSVRLTAPEQETALFSYPAKQGETDHAHRVRAFGTYAREKVLAMAEGKIGRLTH